MKKTLLVLLAFGWAHHTQADWVDLFNGKDFTHFGGAGKTELNGYLVKDGIIESTRKCRNLVTEKAYADYILEFEFQLTPGANNGLGIHYPGSGNAAFAGMELQILDGEHEKYKDKLKDYQHHGSLYSLRPALRGHMKPAGEWNAQRVTVRGPRVSVELNGVCILDVDLDEVNKTHPKHKGAQRRDGKICFAGHGDVIRVRNMRIAELSFAEDATAAWYRTTGKKSGPPEPEGWASLFDGETLNGWEQNDKNKAHWLPKDGWILHYDGKDGDLWTTEEYKDFTFVCDWRWVNHSGKRQQPLARSTG
ncbi:MAG: family 16 glycoside hydrolase, partial [Verrucomicrobiota bacterium]